MSSLVTRRSVSDESKYQPSDWELAYLKWYDPVKGYGFAEQDDKPDVLIHINVIRESGYLGPWHFGARVWLQYVTTSKGRKAVKIAGEAP